jgi:hypothetical protein
MSVDQVMAAFNGEATKTEKEEKWKSGIALVEVSKFEIDGYHLEAKFIFDNEKRTLRQVVLRPKPEVEFPDQLFTPLEQRLIEKYGKADFASDENSPGSVTSSLTRKRSWKKGRSRIELRYFEISGIAKDLNIIYEELPEKGESKL